jgi:hypothetical protein
VRAKNYPAWRAHADGVPVELRERNGQLLFPAPRDGTYVVALEYPRYRGLVVGALGTFLAGIALLAAWQPTRRPA